MSANITQFPRRVPRWTFGDRLRKARRELGVTMDKMASAINVGPKAYAAWESGRNTPSDIADVAVRMERATGIPRTWFLGWMNEEAPRPDGPDGGLDAETTRPAGETSLYHP